MLKSMVVPSVILMAVISCTAQQPVSHGHSTMPAQELVPAGAPMSDSIHFLFGIYMLPAATREPLPVLKEALTARYPAMKLVDSIPENPREMLVMARLLKDVQGKYPPPDMQSLQYFGRGINRQQAEEVQKSQEAFILEFGHPKQRVWTALRAANELVEEVARKTGGFIWDDTTRELFTPEEWHKNGWSHGRQ